MAATGWEETYRIGERRKGGQHKEREDVEEEYEKNRGLQKKEAISLLGFCRHERTQG